LFNYIFELVRVVKFENRPAFFRTVFVLFLTSMNEFFTAFMKDSIKILCGRQALFLVVMIGFCLSVNGQIKLPKLIGDGMVLQRNKEIKIWGWASSGESITLNFKHKNYRTKADINGNWELFIPPQKEGGPYTMTFKGKNTVEVSNILFGDVWFCSGQSNMVLPMERVEERYPDEVANANYPEIRNFFVPTKTNLNGPQQDLPPGNWKSAVKGDIMGFGAVSYFFAKKLYEKYHVPIGLINSSFGGTPIRSWISEGGFKEFPEDLETIQKNKDTAYVNKITKRPDSNDNYDQKDKGLIEDVKWHEESYVPKGWSNYYIPGYWEDQGVKNLNGIVWFRKEIDVPESMIGVEAKLFMGRIVDADEVYVNGTKVGNITYQYPPRRYTVPKGILRPGKNVITVRVTNDAGKGGFVPDKPYYLTANGHDIDLVGKWQYKVGEVFEPAESDYNPFWAQDQPTSLYNAMVAPVVNLKISGILWYQGETDVWNPKPYRKYLPALIHDWRTQFQQGMLPFLYVQIANFEDIDYLPTESNMAELRDAQLGALSVPKTAMAVAIDLGEWNDIHPLNKKDVGERLALGAMKLAYNEELVYSGPIYKSSEIKNGQIILSFNSVGSGLVSNYGEPLNRFEIAGDDQHFAWANAKIDGDKVIVENETIDKPKYVRYAWADNPKSANLYNKEGLPASPFRNYNPDSLNNKPWQGKKAAVVLTYDDALNSHLDDVLPLLDSLNLKATFYVSTYSEAFRNRINDWRKLAQEGHELGNHTIFHPCIGKEDRPWVNENYDMSTYTVERMVDEIKINNTLLEAVDGKRERTFAFTCGDMTVGDKNFFIDELKNDLIGARGVRHEMHKMKDVDTYNIDSYMINGESGEQLIALVKKAIESNSLLVFLFHGVGGDHSLNVSLAAHRQLLEYLKQHEDEVWSATTIEAVKNIKKNQTN